MAGSGWTHAEIQWIDGVETLFEKDKKAAVQVQLSKRFSVVSIEKNTGQDCVIRLQPDFTFVPDQGRYGKETLPWQATETLPLSRLHSEWIGDQLWVSLHFEKDVHCQVQSSGDRHNLWVTISPYDTTLAHASSQSLQRAKDAITRGNLDQAITLLNAIANSDGHPDQAESLEYLGVAYERKSRFQEAANSYSRYLALWPDSPGAPRVKQRLQGLSLMNATLPAPLKKSTARRKTPEWKWFGAIGNGYQYYSSQLDKEPRQTYQSTWMTDLDLNGRYNGERYDTRIRLAAGYWKDFENELEQDSRLSRASIDVFDQQTDQQIKLGRQTTQGEGVLGRFDGVHYSIPVGELWRANLLAGSPVYSSRQVSIDSERQLSGASVDFEPANTPWRSNLFLAQQTYNGMTERQAIGTEISYATNAASYIGYVDYDIFFNEPNAVMLNANWYGKQESSYYLGADYRRSPVLLLDNALIGQPVDDLDALLSQGGYNESTLEQIALDRTALSTTLSGGTTQRFNKQYGWGIDLSSWQLSDTDSSAGVESFEGTDVETNIGLQLTGNDLIRNGDLHWLTLRFADLTTSQLVSFTAESRFPLSSANDGQWRLRPRLRLYQRDFTVSDGSQASIQPVLKLEYAGRGSWAGEIDLGAEWLSTDQGGVTVDRIDYIGYARIDWLF